jgi:hypothetical protein
MIMRIVKMLALARCAFIQQKVEMDASTAAVACFKILEPVVGRVSTGFHSSQKWWLP